MSRGWRSLDGYNRALDATALRLQGCSSVLVVDRFARDREDRLFDLATGLDVDLRVGAGAEMATGRTLVADIGHLHDSTPFAALIRADGAAVPIDHPVVERTARSVAESLDHAPRNSPHDIAVHESDGSVRQAALWSAARESRAAGVVPVSLAGLRRLRDVRALRGRSTLVIGGDGSVASPAIDVGPHATAAVALAGIGATVLGVVRVGGHEPAGQSPRPETGVSFDAATFTPASASGASACSIVAERGPGWGSTRSGAAWERKLQRLRGIARRRDTVDTYLASSLELAHARWRNASLAAAASVAHEAWTSTRWWRDDRAGVPGPVLHRVLELAVVDAAARVEGGAYSSLDSRAATLVWAAQACGIQLLAVQLRTVWATAFRLRRQHDRVGELLGDDWPHAVDPVIQLAWAREAVWNAWWVGRFPGAAEVARPCRRFATSRDGRVASEAHRTLALLYALLGDRVAALAEIDALNHKQQPGTLASIRQRALGLVIGARHTGLVRRQASQALRGLTPALRDEVKQLLHGATRRQRGWFIREGSGMQDVLEVLRACQDDRQDVLDRVCGLLRDRLGAVAVGIWTGDAPDPVACAGTGRGWPVSAAHRACSTGVPHGPEASAGAVEAAWPVTYAGAPIGALACRWLPGRVVDRSYADVLLTAAATACASLVRESIDREAEPIATDNFGLIGGSPAMQSLRAGIARAARVPYHVLIEGESGSGKEVVARAIHQASPRRQKRLCAINCAALTDELLEAELFGHTRGAFTGALTDRTGVFEEASGGTLFLDEVADLSPRGQAKVLRVVQDGEIRRLGESFSRRVDVRIVAASNKPLRDETTQGRFREDLRYRLEVLRLVVPPLRDRPEDIPLLLAHFWREAADRVGSRAGLGPDLVAALTRYHWPGNVRELQNVVAGLAVHAPRRGRLGPGAVPDIARVARANGGGATLDEARRSFELEYVRSALARAGGRRADAARELGLTRQGLAKLLVRLQLEPRAGPVADPPMVTRP